MKTTNLQVAMKLAKILNRPLEELYDGPGEEIEQVQEEVMEGKEESCEEELDEDVQEIRNNEVPPDRISINEHHENSLGMVTKYGGRISPGGKLICHTKDMSRKEYLAITKDMTEGDILASPLMYVLFRSEGQVEGHFVEWLSRFPKE